MGEKREYSVTIHATHELDEDRVEEWVESSRLPGDKFQVQDVETGDIVYSEF